jgi:hypothetical protein
MLLNLTIFGEFLLQNNVSGLPAFFLVQNTKTGGKYQVTTKYTKWP